MQQKTPFYITTAIAYASRKPHIGNCYDIVLADMIARYKRMTGYDVFFMTGSDEHGQKIEDIAKEQGISPQEYVDGVAALIKEQWDCLNTTYDKFIRTTDADHESVVQKIFKKLYEQGDIYKSEYEGKYCIPCESFFTSSQSSPGIQGNSSAAKCRFSPGARFLAMRAASMGMVPEPQNGSQNGSRPR